jgi:probable DNA repair protein
MPHPFLPIELQRQHLMPHASQEREYQFTSHLTKRFTEQAHHVILSYPQMADDKPLMPSHLIRHYPLIDKVFHEPAALFDPNLILEPWHDTNVPLKDKDSISGGVGLLQSQSVCPFQAFARYRLNVDVLEPAENGLTFAQRGELTHSALEYFWKTVKKSATLHQLNLQELEDIIEKSVHHALKPFCIESLSQKHLEIEHSRLKQLINDWIVLEKQRPEFTVLHTEKNINIEVSKLKLRARIDRIDELSTGEIILIDYKTGQIPAADWLDPRPTQVQLPVYAISYPKATHVAIAKVKANEHQFKQIDDFELSWEDMLYHWQQTLTHLADEFIAGHNEVSPIEGEQTCQYCGLELLCRIRSA